MKWKEEDAHLICKSNFNNHENTKRISRKRAALLALVKSKRFFFAVSEVRLHVVKSVTGVNRKTVGITISFA